MYFLQVSNHFLTWDRADPDRVDRHRTGRSDHTNDDEMGVGNDRLPVRGVECLRVVEASVTPTMPGGNTYVPTRPR